MTNGIGTIGMPIRLERSASNCAPAPGAGLILRYLIVSDIHGNREGLEAVLRDAKGKYERAICCGDLCDYGPDSDYVIDWARENLPVVIRGNHDRVCAGLDSLEQFTALAQASALWTMEHLSPVNRTYLLELPEGPGWWITALFWCMVRRGMKMNTYRG